MNTIIGYLKQDSTWRGIIGILALAGIHLAPDQTESIITAGVSLISAILVFRNK